jgi:hypothetical protein
MIAPKTNRLLSLVAAAAVLDSSVLAAAALAAPASFTADVGALFFAVMQVLRWLASR